ncbi:MAG TPA: metallophosphoesterase family protein [Gemmataceae bacterium]|nr:metallophosphoesterase family protein [Gemmataceae bacterium]
MDHNSDTVRERTIAIGDIHGCSIALKALLETICPTTADTIITLGDYIDRGPDSRGVLDLLLALRDECTFVPLMGNHEEMLLAARESRSELQFWLKFGGEDTLRSYGEKGGWEIIPGNHLEFIRGCRKFFETTSHIFVHASYDPKRPMHEQSTGTLFWETPPFDRLVPHVSGKTVIVGHTSQLDGFILDLGFFKCIDTFCHSGGWLTALDIETGNCWQANQQGKVRPGGTRDRIGTVHKPASFAHDR